MPKRIRVEGLRKRFGPVMALDGLSFDLEEGQCVALIGPNGAGKSSLLRLLAGIARSDGGRIEGLESFRSSYIPDSLEFPAGSSALAWLAYLARLKGAAKGRREAELSAMRALGSLGLSAHAEREAASLSRGMKQRLLFAQALLGGPDLYLMDESSSGLDPVWTIEWKARVEALKSVGATIVFSTHRLEDAAALGDRIFLLSRGRLLRDEGAFAWRSGGERRAERRFLDLIGEGAA
jgi:ABC-type multidrug transport system ATPase subunit